MMTSSPRAPVTPVSARSDYSQFSVSSGAYPILYGCFPARYRYSWKQAKVITSHDRDDTLPKGYRPPSSRKSLSKPQVDNLLERLTKPTTSSMAKINFPLTKDAKVVANYKWSNDGIATYRDTTKCIYDSEGSVKSSIQK